MAIRSLTPDGSEQLTPIANKPNKLYCIEAPNEGKVEDGVSVIGRVRVGKEFKMLRADGLLPKGRDSWSERTRCSFSLAGAAQLSGSSC